VIDDLAQTRNAPIVHVGSRQLDVSNRRCLERVQMQVDATHVASIEAKLDFGTGQKDVGDADSVDRGDECHGDA